MSILSRKALGAFVAFAVLVLSGAASAQPAAFPAKPVTIIAPFAPGGAADILSRIMADNLRKVWGQPVIVENRPGAGSNIGTNAVAKAAPDGYTLLMGSLAFSINASLYKKLPFDPVKDFAPVSLLATGSYMLVAHPSLPARTVQELVALAKAKPGEVTYGSAGNGSGTHLGMEVFRSTAGIQLVHVPYQGTGPAVNATVAGQVMLDMDSMLAVSAQVRAGNLRALAVTSPRRSPLFPDVPTIEESGYPQFEVSPWYGVLAPAGTPPDVIANINAACAKVLAMPQVQELFRAQGLDIVGGGTDRFAAVLSREFDMWRKAVAASGARVE